MPNKPSFLSVAIPALLPEAQELALAIKVVWQPPPDIEAPRLLALLNTEANEYFAQGMATKFRTEGYEVGTREMFDLLTALAFGMLIASFDQKSNKEVKKHVTH